MDKQSKLLDENYLKIRIQELKGVRRKEVGFRIHASDRVGSISKYITLYSINDGLGKAHQIRISDHIIDCNATQFIINPNDDLTKKKKEQFKRTLELTEKKVHRKTTIKMLDKISREM